MEKCKSNGRWSTLLPLLSLVSLVSCARPGTVSIEQPVGPGSSAAASGGQGWLVVYTDTEKYVDPALQIQFSSPTRLPYTVADPAGKVVQTVVARDENPEIVSLEAGKYLVRAGTLQGGAIEVKVDVVVGQTTNVVLDGSWSPEQSSAANPAVYSPSGSFVGWRAAS